MSFSKDVKEELAKVVNNARHCRIAELAAIISFCGHLLFDKEGFMMLEIQTENEFVARKYFTLLKKTFNIDTNVLSVKNSVYAVQLMNQQIIQKVLQAVKSTSMILGEGRDVETPIRTGGLVAQQICCRRAFIRGAFLSAGSMTNPQKSYHFEIVAQDINQAKQIQEIINSFSMDAKIVLRKKYNVVYIKEGSQIVDLLNIMEAHVALMNLENVRILKEVRNSVNRKVNCEAANLNKTVVASSKQIDDIIFIRDHIGFSNLTEGLEAIAKLRMEYPEASLTELGHMVNPPLGRSGVNHRLKKLSRIADDLRGKKEDMLW